MEYRERCGFWIVEDNVADAHLVIEALRECFVPTQITVIGDGLQALPIYAVRDRTPVLPSLDLLLLDLNLLKIGGRGVLVKIKSDVALKHIPVIIFTSSEADRDYSLIIRVRVSI